MDEQSPQGQADLGMINSQPTALVHVPMMNCGENRVDLIFAVFFSLNLQSDFYIWVFILDLRASKQRVELDPSPGIKQFIIPDDVTF